MSENNEARAPEQLPVSSIISPIISDNTSQQHLEYAGFFVRLVAY